MPDTLEEKQIVAETSRAFRAAPNFVGAVTVPISAGGSKSATELSSGCFRRPPPRVYAGAATVTDLTATSCSSAETLSKTGADDLSSHEAGRGAAGDVESNDVSDAGGDEESWSRPVDDDAEAEAPAEEIDDVAARENSTAFDTAREFVVMSEPSRADVDRHVGGASAEAEVRIGDGEVAPAVRNEEPARIVSRKWRRRLENNLSVVNLCSKISLMDQVRGLLEKAREQKMKKIERASE